jgi:hypothetical protein
MQDLPEKLNIVPLPLCSDENDKNEIARRYNSLNPNDSQRVTLYEEWKKVDCRAFID